MLCCQVFLSIDETFKNLQGCIVGYGEKWFSTFPAPAGKRATRKLNRLLASEGSTWKVRLSEIGDDGLPEAFIVATAKISVDRIRGHRLQENEENGFLPVAYHRSNLTQAANIKLVRERGVKFTASFPQFGANRPFPAGSPFSAGPRRAA